VDPLLQPVQFVSMERDPGVMEKALFNELVPFDEPVAAMLPPQPASANRRNGKQSAAKSRTDPDLRWCTDSAFRCEFAGHQFVLFLLCKPAAPSGSPKIMLIYLKNEDRDSRGQRTIP
jgi:hypothetical protein